MRSQAHGALELAALRDPTHINACLRACGHVGLLAKLGTVMHARVGARPCVGAGRTALASLCGAAHWSPRLPSRSMVCLWQEDGQSACQVAWGARICIAKCRVLIRCRAAHAKKLCACAHPYVVKMGCMVKKNMVAI